MLYQHEQKGWPTNSSQYVKYFPSRYLTFIDPFLTFSQNVELLEEEKNPDLYRQSSAVENSQVLQSQAQSPMKLLNPSLNPQIASKAPSRQPSEFNLHKDMIESMRRDRTKSMTMVLENGGVIDESVYKLTKEQHEMIYLFVEERTKMMKAEIRKLNSHLSSHDKEVEELALILEELRTCEKDIANCVEDLRSFSVFNEEEYYKRLEKDCQFAKELITEYRTYQNGLCNFETMRQEIFKILKKHNIYPEEKLMTASVNFENTTEAPIFQPPVENSIVEKKNDSAKYEAETPQSFQITTVFEEVEGQAVEPKPMNNELEPLKEEEEDEEVKKQEEVSPSLPFRGLPAKNVLVDGKVTLEKTIEEGGENSELRTGSNYLVHYEGVLKTEGSEESPKRKETTTKATADLFEVIPKGQSVNIQDEEQKMQMKPETEEKAKRAKKLRPTPGERKQNNRNEEDIMDSKSDLESIGVDVRFSQKDFEISSIKSLRSKKAVEVYNVDFGAGQVELKQITKKVNRNQMKEKVEL